MLSPVSVRPPAFWGLWFCTSLGRLLSDLAVHLSPWSFPVSSTRVDLLFPDLMSSFLAYLSHLAWVHPQANPGKALGVVHFLSSKFWEGKAEPPLVWFLVLLLISCITKLAWANYLVTCAVISLLQHGLNISRTYILGVLWRWHELMHVSHLEQCMVHSKCPVHVNCCYSLSSHLIDSLSGCIILGWK